MEPKGRLFYLGEGVEGLFYNFNVNYLFIRKQYDWGLGEGKEDTLGMLQKREFISLPTFPLTCPVQINIVIYWGRFALES